DRPRLLLPLHDPVVREVAPEQEPPVAEPYRPFGPTTSGRQAFGGGVKETVPGEAGMEHVHRGVRISLARLGPRILPSRRYHPLFNRCASSPPIARHRSPSIGPPGSLAAAAQLDLPGVRPIYSIYRSRSDDMFVPMGARRGPPGSGTGGSGGQCGKRTRS